MAGFLTPVDISNRALQHCGAARIDPALGFAENSKNASETAFCYDKLRRAELRRNVWRFAIKRTILRPIDTDTMILAPALWVETTTYFVGSIVSDENNIPWISVVPDNLGNDPQNSLTWQQYFGPMTVALYAAGGSYSNGELVYTADGDGRYRVYLSREDANSDDPAAATAWAATSTYFKNQVVTYSAIAYMSLIDLNENNQPNLAPAIWSSGTTYGAAAQVAGSDGLIYSSIGAGNLGHDPVSDTGIYWTSTGVLVPWTTVFTGGAGSLKWLQIGGTEFPSGVALITPNIIYPVGTGPSSQSVTRNILRLPANFLRKAPSDPKAGSQSNLGAPTNLFYDDWLLEGPYIVTRESLPIMIRFVADTVDVTSFDDMFCEGLAARIGLEVCEPLTQSSSKLSTIAALYKQAMSDARAVNAIEIGSEEPPMDDFLSVRY